MRRLLPSSLFGQVMVSVGLALLVAQVVSALLLYQASEERRVEAMTSNAAFQLIRGAERVERREARRALRLARAEQRRAGRQGQIGRRGLSPERPTGRAGPETRRELLERPRPPAAPPPFGLPPESISEDGRAPIMSLRYSVSEKIPFDPDNSESGARRDQELEHALREALAQEAFEPHQVLAFVGAAGQDPFVKEIAQRRERMRRDPNWRENRLFTFAIQREAQGKWEAVRIIERNRPQAALGAMLFQTVLILAFLLVILFLVLRRITRPLAQLTDRVEGFSRQPDQAVLMEESGPSDTRRLIAAHNAMETRVAALLDEKDVMLGAIGHDLKTPLAALRVRVESVPDDRQRKKMADSIEDITATLDDILSLARIGRDGAEKEAVDLGALVAGIAEEFEDMGEEVTTMDLPMGEERLVARIQTTWIKRALRNLVSNAVRYGGNAQVSVIGRGGQAILRVEDDGPGIDPGQIAQMLEPFTRGEASRNRATGGAGLGLTLARAIAEQHGGSLQLTNRESSGLRAEIRLPLAGKRH